MFGLGFQELIVIGVLALLILGPKKLPELARTVGKVVREFQRAADDVKKEIHTAALDDEPLRQIYPPRPPAPDPSAKAYGMAEDLKPVEAALGTESASGASEPPGAPAAPQTGEPVAADAPAAAGGVKEPENSQPGPSPRAG